MMLSLLRKLFARKPAARKPLSHRRRLGLEALEDRSVPATMTGWAPTLYSSLYAFEQERVVARSDVNSMVRTYEDNTGIHYHLTSANGMSTLAQGTIPGTSLSADSGLSVAMSHNGLFVIAWTHSQGSSTTIHAAEYRADGQAIGGPRTLSWSGTDTSPSVGIDNYGEFAIAYFSRPAGTTSSFIQLVESDTSGDLWRATLAATQNTFTGPQLAMNTWGGWAVAYTQNNSHGYSDVDFFSGVYSIVQGHGVVATGYEWFDSNASIALASNGNFVVSYSAGNGSWQWVYAQRMSFYGQQLSGPLWMATSYNREVDSSVSMSEDGRFVVTWRAWNTSVGNPVIQFAEYNANNDPVGATSSVGGGAYIGDVSMSSDGSFAVDYSTPLYSPNSLAFTSAETTLVYTW
jgi:hypothetical protein